MRAAARQRPSPALLIHPRLPCSGPCFVALLQHVLGEDLKASDIEVGVASAADGARFRKLTAAE